RTDGADLLTKSGARAASALRPGPRAMASHARSTRPAYARVSAAAVAAFAIGATTGTKITPELRAARAAKPVSAYLVSGPSGSNLDAMPWARATRAVIHPNRGTSATSSAKGIGQRTAPSAAAATVADRTTPSTPSTPSTTAGLTAEPPFVRTHR